MNKKNHVSINGYLLALLMIITIGLGVYGGYYYASRDYEQKETSDFTANQDGLICEVSIRKGKNDVKSEYFIFETSAKDGDCAKYIDYQNLPDDTESYWLGL